MASPRRHYLPNWKQASLLTKTSWDSGWSTSTWEGAPVVHPENQAAGEETISHSDHTHQTPGHLSCSDLGRAQNAGPTESVCLLGVPGCPNLRGLDLGSAYNPGLASDSSWQSNLELKQCRQGKYTCHERRQTQCGRDTASTRQCYLFAESLPPHSTTEQVSLKKCPPWPPCVRVEIRHWRPANRS